MQLGRRPRANEPRGLIPIPPHVVEALWKVLKPVASGAAGAVGGVLVQVGIGKGGKGKHKTCPECAEPVQRAARVCKFCGYRFADPSA